MGYTTRILKKKRKYHFEIFMLLMIPLVLFSFMMFLKYYKTPMNPEISEKSVYKVLVIRNDGSEQYKGLAFKIGQDTYTSSLQVFDFIRESAQNKDTQYYIENFQKELIPIAKVISMDENTGIISFQTLSFRVSAKPIATSHEFFSGDKIWAAGNRFNEIFDFRRGRILPLGNSTKGQIQFKAALSNDNIGGPLLNEYGQAIGVVVKTDESSRVNEAISFEKIHSLIKNRAFRLENKNQTFSVGLKYGMNCNEVMATIRKNTQDIIENSLNKQMDNPEFAANH